MVRGKGPANRLADLRRLLLRWHYSSPDGGAVLPEGEGKKAGSAQELEVRVSTPEGAAAVVELEAKGHGAPINVEEGEPVEEPGEIRYDLVGNYSFGGDTVDRDKFAERLCCEMWRTVSTEPCPFPPTKLGEGAE